MNQTIKALWLNALRSGEYQQTEGALRDDCGHCCLGVLCDLHRKATGGEWKVIGLGDKFSYRGESGILPDAVMHWAELGPANPEVHVGYPTTLSGLNDGGYTFALIADLIEEQL